MGCCSSDLSQTAGQGRALVNGDVAPEFQLENVDGSIVNSATYTKEQGSEYLVVCFYRGGWCPFCNGQIKKFDAKTAEFKAAGGSLVFLSPSQHSEDSKKKAKDPAEKRLGFPTLQDKQNLVGKKFGVVHKSAPASAMMNGVAKINSFVDENGETKQGAEEVPVPCVFIIRPSDNKILWSFGTEEAGMTTRADPDTVIKAIEDIKSGKVPEPATPGAAARSAVVDEKVPLSADAKVVIFSIENCPYCTKAKKLLEPMVSAVDYKVYFLDGPEAVKNSQAVEDSILRKYDHETMPAVFINGDFIGGFSDLDAKDKSGELATLLA